MKMETVKKQYIEYMKRRKVPKTVDIPTEVVTKKKSKK
jgi:hypothetical protein